MEEGDKPKGDEITIDFSKIRNFFKPKAGEIKEQKHEPAQKEHKADEEISLDFSKIKGFFSKINPKSDSEGKKDDETIAVDWSLAAGIIKKYSIILLILIPIFISIYIRMLPDSVPLADKWAVSNVMTGIRANVKGQISQQYPNLPDANLESLTDAQMQKVLKENKPQIDQQIKGTADYIRGFFKDENGYTYMPDIDPYYWYRYAKNILEKGYPGDEIREGRNWDNHQVAPSGRTVSSDTFHSYSLAYFHKIASIFVPSITLFRSMSYYPIVISAISILLAFLIGRRISGDIGGFFCALAMSVSTFFIIRTLFGHADSDAWVLFFPMIITFFFVEAFEARSIAKIAAFSALSGFFTSIYALAWNGWWYIFDFLLAVLGILFLYILFIHRKRITSGGINQLINDEEMRHVVIGGAVFFISCAVFVTAIMDFDKFMSAFYGPLGFSNIKAPSDVSLWPNVLTTVAELNPGSYDSVVNSVGGKFLWWIAIAGVFLTLLKKDVYGRTDIKYFFLLAFWMAATTYASILGTRFILLVVPAFSLAFGTALGIGYMRVNGWMTESLHIHKAISGSVLIILFLMLFIQPANRSVDAASQDLPLVNDAWYNSLIFIKQNSTQNAIITSWWDYGHHFKAIADRPVTFDGTTQTSEASHWVGRFLSTSDEREAIGILRMLDCGHNQAFDTLKKMNNNTHKSIKMTKEIILLEKKDAMERLKSYGLTQEQADTILKYTHCNPPEAYFIASDDMVGKSGVWGHFGAWNFEKADIWYKTRSTTQEVAVKYIAETFNYTKERAESAYFEVQSLATDRAANDWIAPWPGYAGTTACSRSNANETIFACGNGLNINQTNFDIYGFNQQNIVHPLMFAYLQNGTIKIRRYENTTTIPMGITAVKKDEDRYDLVISSPELTAGMFTRMFYMGGEGLRHFKLVSHQKGLVGADIYVYKVDWQGE